MMVNSQVLWDWPISEQFSPCHVSTRNLWQCRPPTRFHTVLQVLVVPMQGTAGLPELAEQCETFKQRHCQLFHGRPVQRPNGVPSEASSDGSKWGDLEEAADGARDRLKSLHLHSMVFLHIEMQRFRDREAACRWLEASSWCACHWV